MEYPCYANWVFRWVTFSTGASPVTHRRYIGFTKILGMFGRIYLSLTEHCLYESHPDNTIPDLRLDQPFAEIERFCTKFDLDKMTSTEHSHVPYIVPLFQALSSWRRDNDNKFPSSYKEKVQVRQLFEKMRLVLFLCIATKITENRFSNLNSRN